MTELALRAALSFAAGLVLVPIARHVARRLGIVAHPQATRWNQRATPLLGGPVDIYVEGSLLLTAPLSPTDRGGTLRVGLGVEERIKVARNATVKEDTAGLLRGSTSVEHSIAIDLVSSLSAPIDLELVERSPVSDLEDLEIELLGSDPKGESSSAHQISPWRTTNLRPQESPSGQP